VRSTEKFSKAQLKRYNDLFRFARRVVARNRAYAGRWREKDGNCGVVLYHLAKALNLLDAIQRLCHGGFAREAIAMSRSLFNLFINLRWLTKPKVAAKRLEGFTDHVMTSKANNAMTLIKWDRNTTDEQKRAYRALIRRTRPVAQSLGIKQKKGGMYAKWHPGIEAMAKDVKLLNDYHITYARLSQTEHSDPESVREHLSVDDSKGLMRGDVGPSSAFTLLVVLDSIRYFL
jgi:hypothetical protein